MTRRPRGSSRATGIRVARDSNPKVCANDPISTFLLRLQTVRLSRRFLDPFGGTSAGRSPARRDPVSSSAALEAEDVPQRAPLSARNNVLTISLARYLVRGLACEIVRRDLINVRSSRSLSLSSALFSRDEPPRSPLSDNSAIRSRTSCNP